jgi:ribonuclease D
VRLPANLIQYAADDVRHLLPLAQRLRDDLAAVDVAALLTMSHVSATLLAADSRGQRQGRRPAGADTETSGAWGTTERGC